MSRGESDEGAVLVANIPEDVQEGELWDYFFQEENGGGEVNSIDYILDSGCAIVVFESQQVALNITSTRHVLHGVELYTVLSDSHQFGDREDELLRMAHGNGRSDDDSEVVTRSDGEGEDEVLYRAPDYAIGYTDARDSVPEVGDAATAVTFRLVGGGSDPSSRGNDTDSDNEEIDKSDQGPFTRIEATISRKDLEEHGNCDVVLGRLQNDTGVVLKQRKGSKYKLQGTLDQIVSVRDFLSSCRNPTKPDITSTRPIAPKTYDKRKGVESILPPMLLGREMRRPKTARLQTASRSKLVKVDETSKQYLLYCFREKLRDLQDRSSTYILYRDDGHVTFYPSGKGDARIEEAYRTYRNLYQHIESNLIVQTYTVPADNDKLKMYETYVKKLLRLSHPGVMVIQGDTNKHQWSLCGLVKEDVETAKKCLKENIELDESELKKLLEDAVDDDLFTDVRRKDIWEDNILKATAPSPKPTAKKEVRITGDSLEFILQGTTISIYRRDLTKEKVDVIVNASNESLKHIGGVAWALKQAAGQSIQTESDDYIKKYGPLQTGDVVRTDAGKLSCKHILHANGPRWTATAPGDRQKLLHKTYMNVFIKANNLQATSIAMPTLSAGIFGFPKEISGDIAYTVITTFISSNPHSKLKDIRLVDMDKETVKVLINLFADRLGVKAAASTELTGGDRLRHEEGSSRDVEEDNTCQICLNTMVHQKQLSKCKHRFCPTCIEEALKHDSRCPVCRVPQKALIGHQPPGTMQHRIDSSIRLPGYESHGAIIIDYNIPSGIQTDDHPNPGQRFSGTARTAYLPNNEEGKAVLDLLRQAFENRLTFAIGTSHTTGVENVVVWNDIHHKTSIGGGPTRYGYPDPDYLRRVKEELAAKGIQ